MFFFKFGLQFFTDNFSLHTFMHKVINKFMAVNYVTAYLSSVAVECTVGQGKDSSNIF
jgi:hypothetical protein